MCKINQPSHTHENCVFIVGNDTIQLLDLPSVFKSILLEQIINCLPSVHTKVFVNAIILSILFSCNKMDTRDNYKTTIKSRKNETNYKK
jgi:hypothetical protein